MDIVEAVVVCSEAATKNFASAFTDQPESQAEDALGLAVDLGLLSVDNDVYRPSNPMCRYLVSSNLGQKAALLRIVLDSYEPFGVFLSRLIATDSPAQAAEQTRIILDLDAHRGEIKDTLISLGTYAQILSAEGGGRYVVQERPPEHDLRELANACTERSEAGRLVRRQLGDDALAVVSSPEVIAPLTDALWRARGGDPNGAVQQAGNAIESFLKDLGDRTGVDLSAANGINAKCVTLQQDWALPRKLTNVGRYLGHIRNAADHGIDPDIGYSWDIRDTTGLEYVFVGCSFIRAVVRRENGKSGLL